MSDAKSVVRTLFVVAIIASALGAVGVAQASAVTRYAAPGANGPSTNCTHPLLVHCSIATAASGFGVTPADSVVVVPGTYTDADINAGGGHGFIQVAGDIHGQAGKPRPVINLSVNTSNEAIVVNGTVSHLELNDTGPSRQKIISMDEPGDVVEDLIARSSSGGTVCAMHEGLLRNSVCLATGTSGTAVGSGPSFVTGVGRTPEIRGVTAVASGTSSATRGLGFYSGTTEAPAPLVHGDVTAYVKNTIARAPNGGFDIEVAEHGTGLDAATIQIDYSNYATTQSSSGGTISDNGNQQSIAPIFLADGYHQHPDSASTLNVGQVDAGNGTADIDGQNRTINLAPDIGADERGRATSTSVACAPPSVFVGSASACTATVGASGLSSPEGTVQFISDSSGVFSATTCTLAPSALAHSNCQVTYTPSVLGTGTHQINVTHPISATTESSQGQTDLGVTPVPPDGDGDGVPDASDNCPTVAGTGADGCPPPPPVTTLALTPAVTAATAAAPAAKKCKKGRKLKRGKCVRKKKK